VIWGNGIPERLRRRLPVDDAIVLNDWDQDLQPGVADFVLLTRPRVLPPSGRMGVLLDPEQTMLTVSQCMPDSPCQAAGLQRGDRFLSIDGEPVPNMTELHLVMWDKRPGDSVTLRVRRKHWFRAPEELSINLRLR
jgi:S1-C subfamily serine protease